MQSREICDLLACQDCGGELRADGEFLTCAACGRGLDCSSGIVRLRDDDTYYWGEIPLADMRQVLSVARSRGWRESVEEIIVARYPHYADALLAANRVDWIHLGRRTDLTILDVGSGWGQNAFLMAQHPGNRVVSLEQIPARAEFQAIRKSQDRAANLCVVNGDFAEVGLRPGAFDRVLFCGVLEWLGAADSSASPRDVQLRALRKAHSLLKEDGRIVVGIENRIGFNALLGGRDHSGLRFTSLMPRWMANAYVRLRRPAYRSNTAASGYRTYTYTASGYLALLKEAGFDDAEVLVVHPHYGHPRCFLQRDNRTIRRFFKDVYQPNSLKDAVFAGLFAALSRIGLAGALAPHFLVTGRKSHAGF